MVADYDKAIARMEKSLETLRKKKEENERPIEEKQEETSYMQLFDNKLNHIMGRQNLIIIINICLLIVMAIGVTLLFFI